MKRQALIKELEQAGCILVRHGGRHDVYRNPANGRQAPIPRHREIADTPGTTGCLNRCRVSGQKLLEPLRVIRIVAHRGTEWFDQRLTP